MRASLTNKLIAGAAATIAVLGFQWFDLTPAARAADRQTGAPAAQMKDDAGATAPAPSAKMSRYPIRGKLKAVDAAGRTFTLAGAEKDRVFKTTAQTQIIRQGKPATLAEAVIGDEVGGLVEKQGNGTILVLKVRFGPKTEEEQKATSPKRKPRSSAPKTADVR